MEIVEIDYFGKTLSIETGRMAKQANGSAVVRYGDTTVLVASTADIGGRVAVDFFPLTCVYQVKTYSQGRIPGGFVKRERMPSETETLTSRLIDRPIRPLFDEGFSAETQVIATVLSYDKSASPVSAAMLGASASLLISDLPFRSAIGGITVGRIDGEFVVNPGQNEMEKSDLNLFMVATKDSVVMVESEADGIEEEAMIEALEFGHDAIKPLIELQEKLQKKIGKKKVEVEVVEQDKKLVKEVSKAIEKPLAAALKIETKIERYAALKAAKNAAVEKFASEEDGPTNSEISDIFNEQKKKAIRDSILKKGKRVDGRDLTTVRPIECELGVLPKAHGSALFTRGETQALVISTLGTKDDEQMVDDPTGLHYKRFYVHYNFPAFSVGEVKRIGPPGRREIGHGKLAERGLASGIPAHGSFPYTIRIVSEILESNGSSSMATVCGGSLSLMDAGVPLKEPVAGIAMGLVKEGKKHAVLTDILGDEDHVGDMDFKVVGTKSGITALQMDIKIDGLDRKIMEEALMQAKEGRLHILDVMEKAIDKPRESLSSQAPRYLQYKIPTNKIKDIIGPGGKIIRGITAESGAKIDIDDSGVINIASADQDSAEKALAIIRDLVREVEIGAVYNGRIKKLVDFGAFVEVLPGTEGLVHISQISEERVENVNDVLSEGQMIPVKAIGFDRGKLKLSIKAVVGNETITA